MSPMVIVGLPAPCPGAFYCVHTDLTELFWSADLGIGVLALVVFLFLLWRFTPNSNFKKKLSEKRWSVGSTLLAVVVFTAIYSPVKQYANLKEQYEDARRSEEQRRFDLERESLNRRIVEGRIREIEERLKTLQESVARIHEKSEEILRNLPKTKSKTMTQLPYY